MIVLFFFFTFNFSLSFSLFVQKDPLGNNALHYAVFTGDVHMFDMINDMTEVDLNYKNYAGQTPLQLAAARQDRVSKTRSIKYT